MDAYFYGRVSGKSQILTDGFPRQKEVCFDYAKSNQIDIVQEFYEKGISGTKDCIDRPALSELFVALKTSNVRLILCENASRLARDLMISELLLCEFRKLNVKVISASCGTDLTVESQEPTQVLIRQILGAVSQFEKSMLVQKLRIARTHKKQATGRCEGRKPSNYPKATIERVLTLKASGMATSTIASMFNQEGLSVQESNPSRRWFPSQIARIIARQDTLTLPI